MNHIQKFSEFNNKPQNTNEGFKEWATIFATALALNLVPPQIAKADTETKKEWTEQKSDEILTKSKSNSDTTKSTENSFKSKINKQDIIRKAKDVLNITDGDKYVKSLEKDGWNFVPGWGTKSKIIDDINNKGIKYELSDTKANGNIEDMAKMHFLIKLYKSDEWNKLPKNMRINPDKYLIWSKYGDQYTYKMLIPVSDEILTKSKSNSDTTKSTENSFKSKINKELNTLKDDFGKKVKELTGLKVDKKIDSDISEKDTNKQDTMGIVKQASSKLREQGFDNGPSNFPLEHALYNAIKDGTLTIEDLNQFKNINEDNFYTSFSKIHQNALFSIQFKLRNDRIKFDGDLLLFKRLDSGIKYIYLVPKNKLNFN
jgi:protein required for attachment to host cells